jgi:transcriptional regulator with XRE-family HTH domain
VSLVTQIEQGRTSDPRLSTLRALAKALGVTLDELAGKQPSRAKRKETTHHEAGGP